MYQTTIYLHMEETEVPEVTVKRYDSHVALKIVTDGSQLTFFLTESQLATIGRSIALAMAQRPCETTEEHQEDT
jgi:hypothetical protein